MILKKGDNLENLFFIIVQFASMKCTLTIDPALPDIIYSCILHSIICSTHLMCQAHTGNGT